MSEQSQGNSQPSKEEIAAAKISGIPLPQAETTAEQPVAQEAEQSERTELDLSGEDNPESQESEPKADSETEEIEFEDFKFALPKDHAQKVRDALMRQADYTRKTQDISARDRMLAEKQRLVEAQAQFHQFAIEEISQIRGIEAQIKQYDQLNWAGMDTDTLVRTRHSLDQLKDLKAQAEKSLQGKAQQFQKSQQEVMQKLARAGVEQVSQRIKNFSDKTLKDIRDYGLKEGYQDHELDSIYDPRQVTLMWKAMQFDKLQNSRPEVEKRANKASPVVRPNATGQNQSQDQRLKDTFKKTTDPVQKRRLGEAILAKKLGI